MYSFKRVIICFLSAVLIGVTSASCSLKRKEYDDVNITFFKVGKADSMVIKTHEHAVLIDAANQGEGKEIFSFCEENDFNSLDYFILTHFDQDHVGGAKAVVNKFEIENILQPDYVETSKEYKNYNEALDEKQYTPQSVTEKMTFTLDDALFTVYPPLEEKYDSTNNYSLVITMEYGKRMFLFAGDAENIRLSELMTQLPERKKGYDLVKMPHHGEKEKLTDDFINYTDPKTAVITCSKKEPADNDVIELLKTKKTEIFYTYNGNITFTCNGYDIEHTEQLNKEY